MQEFGVKLVRLTEKDEERQARLEEAYGRVKGTLKVTQEEREVLRQARRPGRVR